jgi:hypothetical protein
VVLIRRAAPGAPAAGRQEDQLRLYRSYAAPAATEHWGEDQLATGGLDEIAETLAAQARAVGADSLNVRIHTPDMTPAEARSHVEALAGLAEKLARKWPQVSDGTA